MIKKSIWTLCLLMLAGWAYAQQNVSFREGNVVSPQVNEDHSVTFRVRAPQAENVMVLGDWAANKGFAALTKGDDGVWTYTTPALPSEMYTYRFLIDGVAGLDPANPFTRRDVGNVFSIFYVGGGCADYYQVRDVPHGTMTPNPVAVSLCSICCTVAEAMRTPGWNWDTWHASWTT